MGLFNKIAGYGSMDNSNDKLLEDYLIDGEQIIQSFKFIRDSIVLTNLGIYMIDVQGMTGKKVEVKFFPGKNIKSISFETASTFDMDVDIKISVDGNSSVINNVVHNNVPISFKVPKTQAQEAKEIIKIVKTHYLFK